MDRAPNRSLMMPTLENDTSSSTSNPLAYRAALDGLRASLMAMPEEQVRRTVTLDATAAAMIAEASANKVEPFRAALTAQFGAAATAVLTARA